MITCMNSTEKVFESEDESPQEAHCSSTADGM
jgi:hypothetical protein